MPDHAEGVAVRGSYAYVTDGYSGLQIVDISDPLNPFIASAYDTPGYARRVTLVGNRAYVADGNFVLVVDISDPLAPYPLGRCHTPGWVYDLIVEGDHVYVADVQGFLILHQSWVCGDVNGSGTTDVSDAVYLVNYLFAEGAAPQDVSKGDANCDGRTNLADAVYLVNFVFGGGPAPCDGC
jgi:hypothetical protein